MRRICFWPTAALLIATRLDAQPAPAPPAKPAASDTFVRLPPAAASAKRWLNELGSTDPALRRAARLGLMSIRANELPLLRELIRAARPLRPAQAEALREIVTHVYIAGTIDRDLTAPGFLGVNLGNDIAFGGETAGEEDGVLVAGVIAGYCAYPFLRPGDVIAAVSPADDTGTVRVRSLRELQGAIGAFAAGARVRLDVERGGRSEQFVIRLDPHPMGRAVADESLARENEAAALWASDFAPLVDPPAVVMTTR